MSHTLSTPRLNATDVMEIPVGFWDSLFGASTTAEVGQAVAAWGPGMLGVDRCVLDLCGSGAPACNHAAGPPGAQIAGAFVVSGPDPCAALWADGAAALHQALVVPMQEGDLPLGSLVAGKRDPVAFSPGQWALAQKLAEWIGQRLITLGHIRVLRRQAITDPLTGAANRLAFTAAGEHLMRGFQHQNSPFALALLDLDHFKAVNDAHGHGAGDRLLKAIVARLSDATRLGDLLCRIGGEEFAILMRISNGQDPAAAAQHWRRVVARTRLELPDVSVGCTCSVGLGVVEPADASFQALVDRTDAALYAAKTGGRDRVGLA